MTDPAPVTFSRRTRVSLLVLGGLVAVLAAFVLYERVGGRGNADQSLCPASVAVLPGLTPAFQGEIAAMRAVSPPRPLPPFGFTTAAGPKTLSDFHGRIILFNLWATWCVPCREEMPALDRLQAALGDSDFSVLALNMDTRNTERVPQWLDDTKITALDRFSDPEGKAFQALRKEGLVTGLPTTFLIGRDGCLIGSMAGPAKWDSPEALALIRAAKTR